MFWAFSIKEKMFNLFLFNKYFHGGNKDEVSKATTTKFNYDSWRKENDYIFEIRPNKINIVSINDKIVQKTTTTLIKKFRETTAYIIKRQQIQSWLSEKQRHVKQTALKTRTDQRTLHTKRFDLGTQQWRIIRKS